MERSPPHTVLLAIALASTAGACARSARGPPLSVDIALARARQALCTAGGIESPRALIATFAPERPCMQSAAAARVRCYLDRPETTVDARRVAGGFRIRVVMPLLSDHVHDVWVRARRDGTLAVSVDSSN